jgi:hypothetical protein
MTGARTAADDYWERYYAEEFLPGQGTEEIITMLAGIPPVTSWVDLGAGSESLLWAIPLRADRLTAVDLDPRRLALLHRAATSPPRPAYRHVLQLCDRNETDFAARQASLTASVVADCLTGHPPDSPTLPAAGFQLVTQFGLLGLAPTNDAFVTAFTAAHRLLAPGGWAAGANWAARHPSGRATLTAHLYQRAFVAAGLRLQLCWQTPIDGDPDFTDVWIYLGRRAP